MTPGEALAHLIRWTHTADVQRHRVLDPDTGPVTFEGDLHLFALAAREVLRFADLVRKTSPKSAWSSIDKARDAFDKECPKVTDIRNVLDHFDDYLRGRGKDFSAGRPSDHASEFVRVHRPAGWFWERGLDSVVLHVSPTPGVMLTLDVSKTALALRELSYAIQDAVTGIEQRPEGN